MHVHVIHINWKWLIVLGLLLMICGVVSMGIPYLSTQIVELVIGIALIASGVLQLVHAIRLHRPKGFFFSIPAALLQLGVGIWLVYSFRDDRMALLFILLTMVMVAEGGFKAYWAWHVRGDDVWIYLTISATVSLIIAALFGSQVLGKGREIVGIMVGLSMLANGFTMVVLGMRSYVPGSGGTDVEVPVPRA